MSDADPPDAKHPDLVTLSRFARGELIGPSRLAIDRHIYDCFDCEDAVEAMRADLLGSRNDPEDSAGSTAAVASPPPRDDSTRYRILGTLGEGGSSDVYLARDTVLSRDVALKLFRDLPPDQLEAVALARMGHPNVVTIHDTVTLEGRPGLAMEVVRGGTLATHRFKSTHDTNAAFRKIGRGLSAAHQLGIVHGDLKPDNILWHAVDETPKIADFGLGRLDRQRILVPSSQTSWAAPELAAGAPPSPRSDQYSFAALWAVALGGPERRRGSHAVPPDIGHLPRSIRRHFARALDPDPGARHPSVAAFVAAVDRGLRRRRLAGVLAIALMIGIATAAVARRDAAAREACLGDYLALVPTFPAEHPPLSRIESTVYFAAAWERAYLEVANDTCRSPGAIDPLVDLCLRVEAAGMSSLLSQLPNLDVRDYKQIDRVLTAIESAHPATCVTPARLATMADARGQPLPLELLLEVFTRTGTPGSESEAHAQTTIAALESRGPSPALAQALLDLEALRQQRGDMPGAQAANERAIQVALALGDMPLLRWTFFTEAEHALFRRHDPVAATAAIARVDAIAAPLSRTDLERDYRLRATLAFVSGDLEQMASHALAGLVAATALGHDGYLPAMDLMLAWFDLGHHDLSLRLAERLLEQRIARSGRDHRRTAGVLRYVGLNLLRLGRIEEAVPAIEEAHQLRRRLLGPDHHETAFTDLALAELLAALGEADQSTVLARLALATLAKTLPPHHFEHRRQAIAVASFLEPLAPCEALSILPVSCVAADPERDPSWPCDGWSLRAVEVRARLGGTFAAMTCNPRVTDNSAPED